SRMFRRSYVFFQASVAALPGSLSAAGIVRTAHVSASRQLGVLGKTRLRSTRCFAMSARNAGPCNQRVRSVSRTPQASFGWMSTANPGVYKPSLFRSGALACLPSSTITVGGRMVSRFLSTLRPFVYQAMPCADPLRLVTMAQWCDSPSTHEPFGDENDPDGIGSESR